MVPDQTLQVLYGAAVAVFYGSAVLAIGVLALAAFLGRTTTSAVCDQIGLVGFAWLGFVTAQGILGALWLGLALAGFLHAWLIWLICILGCVLLCLLVLTLRRQATRDARLLWTRFSSSAHSRPFYFWMASAMAILLLMGSLNALLPTAVDDALDRYLPIARAIAESGRVEFQPFARPFYGLLPLQVEIHWAALFAVSNETAVTLWDYVSSLSFLAGIWLLAWSLTDSHRVSLLAVLMMLSTPAFFYLMGGGKTDNAAAQYGIAAFLWLTLLPHLGRGPAILGGACAGWAIAARYTNVTVLPAVVVFAVMVRHSWKRLSGNMLGKQMHRFALTNVVTIAIAAGVTLAPMLLKNWLLVGCPLAPHFGCQDTFWADVYGTAHFSRQNISAFDLLLYPFVWTFASREDMLGNISPLFVGLFPFLLASYRFALVSRTLVAGFAGLVSITTWLLIKPLLLYTRWLLIPLGLLAVPLSASLVAVEQTFGRRGWLIQAPVLIVLLFLLFESRGVMLAARYVASIDSRDSRYASQRHGEYDLARWLNFHVQPGQRVALNKSSLYMHFVDPTILLESESPAELQWLWENRYRLSPSELCHFYIQRGFTYVVVPRDYVHAAVCESPDDPGVGVVAFLGAREAVLKVEES